MSRDEEPPEDSPTDDDFVSGLLRDTSLWPLLIVAVTVAGTLGAAMLILVGIDHNPFAAAALLLVLGMSVDIFIQSRKKPNYRSIAKIIGVVWSAAIGLAALAIWTGIAL